MIIRDRYLTTNEVAEIFHVAPKTVSRWAKDGLIEFTKTPGGHRRYLESKVKKLLEGKTNAESSGSGV